MRIAAKLLLLLTLLAPKAEAEEVKIVAEGQMPLNQNGDEVALLNPSGDTVDQVAYTSGQVSPGQPIAFSP